MKILTCGWQSDEVYSVRFEDSGDDEVPWLIMFADTAAEAMKGAPISSTMRLGSSCRIELLFGMMAVQAFYSTTESHLLVREIDEEFRNQIIVVSHGAFHPKADPF